MTYIIHGATGAQGSPIVSTLLKGGHSVTAATRTPNDVPEGVTAAAVDLSDTDSLVRLYENAEGVFIHLPIADPATQMTYAKALVEAIALAKPTRVVISTSGAIVDDPSSPLQSREDSPLMVLIRGVEAAGVSSAVVAPRLYLENLQLPFIAQQIKNEGILAYPLPSDYPVSWSSHNDVAQVVSQLLTQPEITGVVSVGSLPGITGVGLAEAISRQQGQQISYQAVTPEAFGEKLVPLFSEAGAAPIVGLYLALNQLPGNVIPAENSAQKLLGTEPGKI